MALYHLHAKIIGRQRKLPDGRTRLNSVIASAAYRCGGVLKDRHTGQTFDYSHKPGVLHSEIQAPAHAPPWIHDREALWNSVERTEKRQDAQLARELEVALPIELTLIQNIALIRDYVSTELVAHGMTADWSLHGENPNNPHVHILLTSRDITPNGFSPTKNRSWGTVDALIRWRAAWARHTNHHLAQAGFALSIHAGRHADLTTPKPIHRGPRRNPPVS